jgi:hypothetical protein
VSWFWKLFSDYTPSGQETTTNPYLNIRPPAYSYFTGSRLQVQVTGANAPAGACFSDIRMTDQVSLNVYFMNEVSERRR